MVIFWGMVYEIAIPTLCVIEYDQWIVLKSSASN